MDQLIGREDDLVSVAALLDGHRLVTIVGPGGIGKTSLAQALVADRATLFVELSGVTDGSELGDVVAKRHGFRDADELIEWLGGESPVVVLDTCEHVVDGAAELAAKIVRRTPGCRVLATSRVPLDAPDEQLAVLGPLAVDGPDGERSPAVELFVQRAGLAGAPAEVLGDTDAIVELCRRLDGMPLAIELAAARTRSMTPTEIAGHLDEGVDVLTRPRFRGASRHRSLRATIEWSFHLLDDEAQALLRRLSIFPGRFDADLAHGVAGAGGTRLDTADLLAELVDRSLLTSRADTTGTRFGLFDTTRAYAEEQLVEAGEVEATREAYVDAVCARAASYLELDEGDWSTATMRALIGQVDDFLAATRLALADHGSDRAFGLVMVLWAAAPLVRCVEIAEVGLDALERWPDPTTPLRADAAATTATALREWGKQAEARELATQALDHLDTGLFAAVSIPRILALLWLHDDPHRATSHAESAIAAADAAELLPFARELRIFRAQALVVQGRPDDALSEVRAVIDETGPTDVNHMWGLVVEGMAQLAGEVDAAGDTLRLALRLSERSEYVFGIGASLRLLAVRSLALGDVRGTAETVLALLRHVRTTLNLGEQGLGLRLGVALLRSVGHPAADEVVALSRGWSSFDVLERGRVDDLSIPDTNLGRSVAPGLALAACRDALEELVSSKPVGPDPGPAEPASATLQRTGDHWTARFAGRTATLRHTKGLQDIATLLASPGREIHILDLVGAGVVEGAADTVIDATAMDAYRERILELQDELALADDRGDADRSQRAQQELDALVEQLSGASGIGGRARRTTGTAERARSTVTKRVRSTIKRLATAHPELARHLDASISTGLYCRYDPEHPVDWAL